MAERTLARTLDAVSDSDVSASKRALQDWARQGRGDGGSSSATSAAGTTSTTQELSSGLASRSTVTALSCAVCPNLARRRRPHVRADGVEPAGAAAAEDVGGELGGAEVEAPVALEADVVVAGELHGPDRAAGVAAVAVGDGPAVERAEVRAQVAPEPHGPRVLEELHRRARPRVGSRIKNGAAFLG